MTPVDLHSDHVMLRQDTTENSTPGVVNNDDTVSSDNDGQPDLSLDEDAENEQDITDQDKDQHEDKENTALSQETGDETSLTALQQMDDDIGSRLLVVSEHTQLDLGNSEDNDGGINGGERTPDGEDLKDIIPPQDDTHSTTEPSELDNDTTVLESNEADTSNGLMPTPIIPEQEHGDIEEDLIENPAVDEYPEEIEDDNELQINGKLQSTFTLDEISSDFILDGMEVSDSKPSVVDSEKADENEVIKSKLSSCSGSIKLKVLTLCYFGLQMNNWKKALTVPKSLRNRWCKNQRL